VGNLITCLAIFHNDWSSGSRDSSVHWSFLHSFSWRITELGRRSTSTLNTWSLVIYQCLLSWFFNKINSRNSFVPLVRYRGCIHITVFTAMLSVPVAMCTWIPTFRKILSGATFPAATLCPRRLEFSTLLFQHEDLWVDGNDVSDVVNFLCKSTY